ncbi:MAG: beta strand repeat-containing protein [Sediminibacterium sp.]
MTIPIITRTNTIDEWRIQTNLSAEKLNDLEFGDFDKSNGTLTISNTTSLLITAQGTPLQVSNNALIQKDLSVGSNLSVGTVGTKIGNVSVGNTVTISGQNTALYVANNAYIGKNVTVAHTAISGNASVINDAYVGGAVIVDGTVRLTGSANVLYANDGTVVVKTADLQQANVGQANVDFIYALDAYIDNLRDISTARIGILNTNESYNDLLYGEDFGSNTAEIRILTANVSADIANLSSPNAVFTTANVNELIAVDSELTTVNINAATINVSTTNTATILNGTVTNGTITNGTITNAIVTNAGIANGVITSGNVITLISNTATLNNSTLLRSTLTNTNISTANVTNYMNVQNGIVTVARTSNSYDAIVVTKGTTRLQNTVIEGNMVISGSFTQTGNINFETDRFILNSNTSVDKDALIVNKRPGGTDAVIIWDEIDERWEISTGDTWSDTYKILDGSDIYTGVDSLSQVKVASASSVNIAHDGVKSSGSYANAAFLQANTTTSNSITVGVYANAAFLRANTPTHVANSAAIYANAAFLQANTPSHRANSAASYANAAFLQANTPTHVANSAAIYANAAFSIANASYYGTSGKVAEVSTIATDAYQLGQKLEFWSTSAGNYANSAFLRANGATSNVATVSSYANSAFLRANNAYLLADDALSKTYGGTVAADVTVTGSFTACSAVNLLGDVTIYDDIVTVNRQFNLATPTNGGFDFYRGVLPKVTLRWNETDYAFEAHFKTGSDVASPSSYTFQKLLGVTTFNNTIADYIKKDGSIGGVSGAAMTGYLNLYAAPTSDLHAATKKYVDEKFGATSALPSYTTSDGYKVLSTNAGGTATIWTKIIPEQMDVTKTFAINTTGRATHSSIATLANNSTWAVTANSVATTTGGVIINNNGYLQEGGTFTSDVRSFFTRGENATSKTTGTIRVTGGIGVSGDIYATTFNGDLNGTASAAKYADLAEKYLADDEYSEGTVLAIGGKKEVTAAKDIHFRALGVVSLRPAYLMNSDLKKGTTVALKGRVPVRVIGKLKKGDPIGLSSHPGLGQYNADKYFALSLENKKDDDEGVVEAVIL